MITLADVLNCRGMKIEKDLPPNIADIEKVFPGVTARSFKGIFFAYGNVIYNPSGKVIPPELLAHEMVHSIQTENACGPERWWLAYLEDKNFRKSVEIEAHRVEYEYVQLHSNRAFRHRAVKLIPARLAGPLYGNLMTTATARRLITEKVE